MDSGNPARIGLGESTALAPRAAGLNKTVFSLVFEFTKRLKD
jgi:hypothetical protein